VWGEDARARGVKVAASFATEGRDGGWQREQQVRFCARRVMGKAGVVNSICIKVDLPPRG